MPFAKPRARQAREQAAETHGLLTPLADSVESWVSSCVS